MNQKRVMIGAMILLFAVTLYFVIRTQLDYAILSMMALFVLTNASRAKSFKEQGMERESKWMRYLSLTFAAAFVIVLILIIK